MANMEVWAMLEAKRNKNNLLGRDGEENRTRIREKRVVLLARSLLLHFRFNLPQGTQPIDVDL